MNLVQSQIAARELAHSTMFGWVKFVVTLTTGSFTVLLALSHSIPDDGLEWIRLAHLFLFLTTVFGVVFLGLENKIHQAEANRLQNDMNQIENPESASLLYTPTLGRGMQALITLFLVSFLLAMLFALIAGFHTFTPPDLEPVEVFEFT